MDCPGCNEHIRLPGKGQTQRGLLQHHLWGHHKIEVGRSHELAQKIMDHVALTEEERVELKQLPLPL